MDSNNWFGHKPYDELLFRAFDRFAESASKDENLEGEYMILDAFLTPVVATDGDYWDKLEQIKKEKDARLRMYKHVALLMERCRYHGHLDQAPKPRTNNGIDFLSQ